ncbi:MAG: acetyltransferase [Verrucomicrobiota bacterium]
MINPDTSLPKMIGIGAGGHCRVMLEIVRLMDRWQVVGLLDRESSRVGKMVDGIPIVGEDAMAATLNAQGVRTAFIGIGSVGDSTTREKAHAFLIALGFGFPVIAHPFSSIASSTSIASGTCVMPGAIINPGTRIGLCAIINSGAIIEHDCEIGDFAHIAPRAVLGGSVTVGPRAHIGIGAVVRPGIRIGENAMIGAGAVVVKDVEAGATVFGVPAATRIPV